MNITDEKQKKYSDILVAFLKTHRYISVNALESDLGIATGTISRALNDKAPIPRKYIYPIMCILSTYGLEYAGYSLKYDNDTEMLFGRKLGDAVKSYEVFQFPDGSEKETEIINGESEYITGSTSSRFYDLCKVEKLIISGYEDLM